MKLHPINKVMDIGEMSIGEECRELREHLVDLGSNALNGQVMITGMDGPSAEPSEEEKRHLRARAYALSSSTSSSRR